jgi:hypothetical protein
MRNRVLFTAELTNLDSKEKFTDFTHAASFRQALRYLGIKYPYPPYLIDSVTNTFTSLKFTREQWIEATKYESIKSISL